VEAQVGKHRRDEYEHHKGGLIRAILTVVRVILWLPSAHRIGRSLTLALSEDRRREIVRKTKDGLEAAGVGVPAARTRLATVRF
jgi:hypothetical protein